MKLAVEYARYLICLPDSSVPTIVIQSFLCDSISQRQSASMPMIFFVTSQGYRGFFRFSKSKCCCATIDGRGGCKCPPDDIAEIAGDRHNTGLGMPRDRALK